MCILIRILAILGASVLGSLLGSLVVITIYEIEAMKENKRQNKNIVNWLEHQENRCQDEKRKSCYRKLMNIKGLDK